jgi:hypothetical protein
MREFHQELATLFHPIHTKEALTNHEAIQHKGGENIPLYKGKNSSQVAESFRAILVSDESGKVYHNNYRKPGISTG